MIYNKHFFNAFSYLILIVVVLLFLTSIHFTIMGNDEAFTLALVKHNYNKIIYLDSLDVHPPLYYLLLKLFIDTTTFWTNSMFIKVITSRIFSIITLILFIFVIHKIFVIYYVHLNYLLWIICFVVCPQIMLSATKIRMYSLSALFLVLELYYLITFINSKNNIDRSLICVIIFSSLVLYTLYFAAISAELFIIIYCIVLFKHKYMKHFVKLLFSGIIINVLYIPWIFVVYKQYLIHSKNDVNSKASPILFYFKDVITSLTQVGDMPLYLVLSSIFLFILFIGIIYYIFVLSNNNKLFNSTLLILLINGAFTLIISLLICKQKFQFRALYPIFSIYYSFILVNIVKLLSNNNNLYYIYKLLSTLIISMSIIYSINTVITNFKFADKPSICLINKYNNWRNNNNNNVYFNMRKHSSYVKNYDNIAQNSLYLSSLNKREIVTHANYSMFSRYIINDPNGNKLIKYLFSNIIIK